MPKLGVNLDHVATIRQQRYTPYPDMLTAIQISELSGADSITMHLREDRRHIQFEDIKMARKNITTKLNLEMAPTEEMCKIAVQIKPDYICIVPEKRQELTTEGGLDVEKKFDTLKHIIFELSKSKAKISVFIEPEFKMIDLAKKLGVSAIELHTGKYAEANNEEKKFYLEKIKEAARYGDGLSLIINAGHGLDYTNVEEIARIRKIHELNIGHSIIAESIFLGLSDAIKKMKNVIESA
ncbi:MAG: pyridoxine 5'-phosphate synthase [Gammaproteobacteria bacterium]|jgi:pyridoxine 5-phosphate synthase|nr:pyridoxine 5'-phosphate synthase [Gammaproteobacteria bacterium]MBT7603982.1 pyridoxine 5'-phosphate synthase [Gammaproteobacteria bacterium]